MNAFAEHQARIAREKGEQRARELKARIARLPVWAKTELERRDRRIAELEDEILALRNAPGALDKSPFDIHAAVLDPFHDKVPIGEGHVRYTLPPGERRRERYIDVRYVEGRQHGIPGVELMASGSLVLRGVASNVFVAGVVDD